MNRSCQSVAIGLLTSLIATSNVGAGSIDRGRGHAPRHHRHGHVAGGHAAARGDVAGNGDENAGVAPDPSARPGPQGPFAGAGGIFSPNYVSPAAPIYHLGGQLLGGGELGNAYEDYYQHYYYYKYAHCPIGSKYVYYLRRCVSPFDLFR